MNYRLYLVLYVFQRIINAPSLPIGILLYMFGALFYGIYMLSRRDLSEMEILIKLQAKCKEIMDYLYFPIRIKDSTFNISHLAMMFWIVLFWYLL